MEIYIQIHIFILPFQTKNGSPGILLFVNLLMKKQMGDICLQMD